MTNIITNLKPGDKVRILHAAHLPEETGKVVEFVDYAFGETYQDTPHPYEVRPEGATGTYYASEVEVVERVSPERPTVTLTKDTSLEYAKAVNSRVLKDENRAVLKAAANGEAVDAYDLNRALTEAMSSCATRAGQSMARRELTKKVRHLAYIVQAVLENHADGLPAYEAGARSRKIETLEGQVAALETAGKDALRLLDENTERLTKVTDQFTDYRAKADAEVTRLLDQIGDLRKRASEVEAVRDNYAEAFGYAVERATETERERAFGYLDALEAAVV